MNVSVRGLGIGLQRCVLALLIGLLACRAGAPVSERVATVSPASSVSPLQPLTRAQRRWVDRTLASLSLRDRVGQMVMVWVLGDYTNVDDPTYAQLRGWVERDHV